MAEALSPICGGDVDVVQYPETDIRRVLSLGPVHGLLPSQPVDSTLIEALPELRVISVAGTGVWDVVDVPAASEAGIAVCNVRDYAASAVAELTFGLMIALLRHLSDAEARLRDGMWPYERLGAELDGRVLGVVGLGSIGSRVAELGRAFGMKVIAASQHLDPNRARRLHLRQVGLDVLLRTSDVVSIHATYDAAAGFLIGREQISTMRRGAILINTARAGLVDTTALAYALRSGALAAAAIDVYEPEPPTRDHPLMALENVVLTPHIGAYTAPAMKRSIREAIENLESTLHGEARNVVNAAAVNRARHW